MKIFVASTSEIKEEHGVIEAFVKESASHLAEYGLEPAVWTWRAVPPSAGRAQQVIFDQTNPESWSIFILIVWHRWGSPTGGKRRSGEEFQSGIEEEFFRVYELWKERGTPHLMVYRCVRPLPAEHDTGQYKQLQDFLKRIRNPRGATPVLLKDFQGDGDFEAKLRDDLGKIFLDAAKAALPQRLRKDLLRYSAALDRARLIEGTMVNQCTTLARHIDELTRGLLSEVGTHVLYETILDSITQYDHVDILDQDINRWNELVDNDHQMFSTFNYSELIMIDTVEHAERNPGYRLRRVFIITEGDVRRYSKRIEKIYKKILEFVSGVAESIEVRFYFVAGEGARAAMINHYVFACKDIVILRRERDNVVLREDIDYQRRAPARKTASEISRKPEEVEQMVRYFDEIFKASLPLASLGAVLNGRS